MNPDLRVPRPSLQRMVAGTKATRHNSGCGLRASADARSANRSAVRSAGDRLGSAGCRLPKPTAPTPCTARAAGTAAATAAARTAARAAATRTAQ